MTLEKATELLKVQADFGGFYNANSAKLTLAEVTREHEQPTVDRLIHDLDLENIFGFELGSRFEGVLVVKKHLIQLFNYLRCLTDPTLGSGGNVLLLRGTPHV